MAALPNSVLSEKIILEILNHLHIIGVSLVLLAGIHIIFPWYFEWKKELALLSLINRQLMQVHTFFIAIVVLLIGLLCLTSAQELITTPLGRTLSLGLAIFWTLRLLIQFFGFSPALWKGKTFETTIHILLGFYWTYLSAVFWIISFSA